MKPQLIANPPHMITPNMNGDEANSDVISKQSNAEPRTPKLALTYEFQVLYSFSYQKLIVAICLKLKNKNYQLPPKWRNFVESAYSAANEKQPKTISVIMYALN